MADGRSPNPDDPAHADLAIDDGEPSLTSPEDVASAGRSCMAIVVLSTLIFLLLVLWVVYRAVGGQ